ncbi:MAG: serine hydrolase [Candidatus Subteraquimicrobiales bacterium]|nr:serine hydrolase [Candidatus Subteraquimicrobiales bacterium]
MAKPQKVDMGLFNRKREEDFDEDELIERPRKIRDLNPENRKTRKELIKPWGKTERLVVLIILLVTVLISGILALTARNFKLPNLPVLKIPDISSLNPFKEQVIIVGNKGSKISQEKIRNTKKLFKEATDNYSGIYAFYIYDLNGDYYYGLNHQEVMQAASLIKLPVMYLAMKNSEDSELIEAMGKRSDNGAYNKIVSVLGREAVNKVILDLGMSNTSLDKNLTTPEETGLFFKRLYKNELLNESKTKELEGYMTDTIFEDWLRPGIPEDIVLVHKYGREKHVINDAGIVMSDKPFVIVIMTDGIIESEAIDLFPKLAKLLYDNHTLDN